MLDTQTAQMIDDLFEGKTCTKCGRPARRMWRKDYYCQECFPKKKAALATRVHRLLHSDPAQRN